MHNGEQFLRDAVDSILAQSLDDFELIAVDDCSSDSSPAILSDYAEQDSRIRVITLTDNLKLPGALNAGFREARADWFTWTSDDNLLLPHTLETLVAARDAAPHADIVYADYRIINSDGTPRNRVRVQPRESILTGNGVGCCFLYRRSVDEALQGYDEQLFGVEDYDFWLRAARAEFTFHPVHEELYLYRRHERSLTDKRGDAIRHMVADVLEREIRLAPQRQKRAEAWLKLFVSDPYTPRPSHLFHALVANPFIAIREWRELFIWLRRAIGWRIK